jgi:hypothetical protein
MIIETKLGKKRRGRGAINDGRGRRARMLLGEGAEASDGV